MAFSNLASNQMVSEADAATGGFALQSGQSHGSGNLMMNKSAATTKYNLDTSALSSYASNQLIPKSAWVSGIPVSEPPTSINLTTPGGGSRSLNFTWNAGINATGYRLGLFKDSVLQGSFIDLGNVLSYSEVVTSAGQWKGIIYSTNAAGQSAGYNISNIVTLV
jgi:hypothetical protein